MFLLFLRIRAVVAGAVLGKVVVHIPCSVSCHGIMTRHVVVRDGLARSAVLRGNVSPPAEPRRLVAGARRVVLGYRPVDRDAHIQRLVVERERVLGQHVRVGRPTLLNDASLKCGV